jgi:hypothetical protein
VEIEGKMLRVAILVNSDLEFTGECLHCRWLGVIPLEFLSFLSVVDYRLDK